MGLRAFAHLDDLAEGHGALHSLVVAVQLLGETLLGQGLPAANDLGGVVHLELVVLVLEQGLDAAADVALFHRQNDDLVVHQQAAPDGLGERDHVEFRAIQGFVIH